MQQKRHLRPAAKPFLHQHRSSSPAPAPSRASSTLQTVPAQPTHSVHASVESSGSHDPPHHAAPTPPSSDPAPTTPTAQHSRLAAPSATASASPCLAAQSASVPGKPLRPSPDSRQWCEPQNPQRQNPIDRRLRLFFIDRDHGPSLLSLHQRAPAHTPAQSSSPGPSPSGNPSAFNSGKLRSNTRSSTRRYFTRVASRVEGVRRSRSASKLQVCGFVCPKRCVLSRNVPFRSVVALTRRTKLRSSPHKCSVHRPCSVASRYFASRMSNSTLPSSSTTAFACSARKSSSAAAICSTVCAGLCFRSAEVARGGIVEP